MECRKRKTATAVKKTPALYIYIYIYIYINQLDAQNFCFTISLFHASTCFEHMCSSSGGQNCNNSLCYYHTCRCDDTRDCVMQFWPHEDEHMCSKHVEAWNKLIVKQKCCPSSWLITEINIVRCTVSKTSKQKEEYNVTINSAELIGTTDHLTLYTKCRINRCCYNWARLYVTLHIFHAIDKCA